MSRKYNWYVFPFMLLTLFFVQCAEEGEFNPSSPDVHVVVILDLNANPNRLPVGDQLSIISGKVIDQNAEPFSETEVTFSAQQGSISALDTTDSDGRFSAEYRSGNEPGIDTVSVNILGSTSHIYLTITGAPTSISLDADRLTGMADGMDTIRVTATLEGHFDAIVGIPVSFESTAGTFGGLNSITINTNEYGQANTLLTAPASATSQIAEVTASILYDTEEDTTETDTTGTSSLTSAGANSFKNIGKLPKICDANLSESQLITFIGVLVTVEASPALILGDGYATSEIRAYVKDVNRQAIPGAEVIFSATLGGIPLSAVTNNSGLARVDLTSAERPGERDLIIARYGPSLSDSVDVEYAAVVSDVILESQSIEIIADGLSSTLITATVVGGTGSPVENIEVYFGADIGSLEMEHGFTDVDGQITVELIAPSSIYDQQMVVWAAVNYDSPVAAPRITGNISSPTISSITKVERTARRVKDDDKSPQRITREIVSSEETVKLDLPQSSFNSVSNLNLSNETSLVLEQHTSRLTHSGFFSIDELISDTISVYARGVQVRVSVEEDSLIARHGSSTIVMAYVFETTSRNPVTEGTVYFSTPSGLGSIPRLGELDVSGYTEVLFTTQSDTGRATIQAQFGTSHLDSTNVTLLPVIGSLEAVPGKHSLQAGAIDQTQIEVTVHDPLGFPAPEVVVIYETDFDENHYSVRTDENGQAQFIIVSPSVEVDSSITVTITAGHITENVIINLRAITRRLTATPDSISAGSVEPVEILFEAFETTSRRPVVGDTVWFSGLGGNVQPSAVLDNSGRAITSLEPDDQPVTAWVYAILGELAQDSVSIELVEDLAQISLSAGRESILANGIDTTAVMARVSNILNDPTPGAWIYFEVEDDLAEIDPEVIQTDNDGLAIVTIFSPALTDANETANIHATAISEQEALAFLNGDPSSVLIPRTERQGPTRLARSTKNRSQFSGFSEAISLQNLNSTLTARRDTAETNLEIEMKALSLTLRCDPTTIRANGINKVGVNVQLNETESGRAVGNAEIQLGASMGSITDSGITGFDGTLTDSLTTGVEPGECEVRAVYGDQIVSTATVTFTPDPNQLNVIFTINPDEAPADGESEVELLARVVNNAGAPIEDVDVVFTTEGALTALVDADEYVNVTHWENVFRVDDPDEIESIRISFQYRDIDSENTRISINRNEINDVDIPREDLWSEAVFDLSAEFINAGVNRISINGGNDGGVIDRFSVAGIRLGLTGSHIIGEGSSDENGRVEAQYITDETAGLVSLRAALTENPDAYGTRRLLLNPGDPALVLISMERDTLIANGVEDAEVLIMVTDDNGNPVNDGHRVDLSLADEGEIEPQQATTFADGTVLARFTSPVVADEDITTTLSAQCEDAEAQLEILLREPVLRLSIPADRMLADGSSYMTIRARLGTNDGAPVVGRRIDFATTHGAITAVDITDNDGYTEAILTSGDSPETATIRASYGPNITVSAEVEFVPVVDEINLSADPRSILGSGQDSTIINIRALNGINEAAENISISIEADQGELSTDRIVTDNDGRATVELFGFATAEDDTIVVIASQVNGDLTDTLKVRVRGVDISVRSELDSLSGNGVSTTTITARVTETESGVPVYGDRRVYFSTTLGSITGGADISEDGIAVATFTAPLGVGEATITASFGDGLNDETNIVIVDRASGMSIEIEPASILANGERTANVEVSVTDLWGEPSPRERVELSFEGDGRVTPVVGMTNNEGIFNANATGNASSSDGSLIISASARDENIIATDTLELRGLRLTLTASSALIRGDGESTSTITANVREVTSGHAVSEDTVWFSSSAGVIEAYVILDRAGQAVTELRSERYAAIATVTATFGRGLSAEVNVAFANRFSYLETELDRDSILANGLDSTSIVATLRDTLGSPVGDVYINYEITNGDGEMSADSTVTDISGTATAVFYSAASQEDADTEIRIYAGQLEETLDIETRGVTLIVTAMLDSLPANGYATTNVTATVRQTTSRNPITAGIVFFSIDAGMIRGSAELNENGTATAILTAPEDPEDATITARYGETLIAETDIVFVNTVESLELSIEEDRILGDGLETVEITARVLDEIDDPASGVMVTFSTDDGGTFDPEEAETDENGYATSSYTGFVSRTDQQVSIEANTEADAGTEVSISLIGITTEISANPDVLPANERSTTTVSLRAFETTSHTALTGHTVTFSADRGAIGRMATLDTSGIGRVTFTAPSEAGDAVIGAVIGDTLLTTFTLPCTESIPEYAELSVDPETITVTGGEGNRTARITALVTDVDHEPVPDGNEVSFTFINDIGLRFADDEDTITVETESGYATAMVTSGEETGSVRFEVLYDGESIGSGGELLVFAGPADRIRVHADLGTIQHPGGGLTSFPVNATVADQFSNPVQDSTIVRFYLTPDDLAQITAVGYTNGGVISTPENDLRNGIWLTFSDDDAGEQVWIHATANGDEAHDSTRIILPGSVEGGEPASMELSSDNESLTADGNSQTTIYARILDDENQSVADMTEVRFTATYGSVQSPRNTAEGEVSSIYRAGRIAGVDTIRVTAGEITDFILITLTPGVPASIELSVEANEIRANGVQFTEINAQLRDRFDNIVASGTEVNFFTELGEIQETANTDNDGTATARLTSGVQTGTTLVSAWSGDAFAQTTVEFVSGTADGIVLLSIDREVIGVRGSGAPETATLIFEVRDDRGVPVDEDHNVEVAFIIDGPDHVIDPDESSEDSVAYLEPGTDTTDEFGRVVVSLNSGFFAGAVEVTATIGDSISGQAISIAIHGGPPDQDHFSLVTNRCVLTGIYGTPVDTTSLWVNVGDRFSNPTVPGTAVHFFSTGGVIRGSARTDSLGQCATLLTSSNPWPIGGVDTVTAQTVDWQDEEIITQTIVLITGPTIVSFDTTSGWRIPFGSYRNFVITVADTFEHPLTAGTSIFIEAEARDGHGDLVEGLVFTGDATEEEIVLEECGQRSRFFIRVFNYVSGTDGANIIITVTVNSRNGDREASLTGTALGQILSTENSRVILSPDEIIADGEDECNVNITLYDVLGIAIPNVPPDHINVGVDGGDPLITPPEDATDSDGKTSAKVIGREIGEGTVQVRADGDLLEEQPTLYFVPGPPARITVQVLDRQLVVGGDTTSVIVDVTDQSGNPTADGTAVIFETSSGSFTPASTITRDGRVVTIFQSGRTAGEASFNVTASQGGGVVEEEITDLTFLAGPPANFRFTTESYLVQVRSVSQIEIEVVDEFGNPVAQNTQINVSVDPEDNGAVAPEAVQVDAEGKATIDFTAGSIADEVARIVAASGDESGTSPPFRFTPGVPGRIRMVLDPDVEEIEVGETIDILATIEDSYGNPVVDTTRAQFSTDPEDIGSLSPTAVNTSDGEARSRLSGVTQAGDVEVIVEAGDISATTMITFTVGALAEISVIAEPNLVQFGRSSTLTATATDRYGNPVAGELLNFTLTTNPGGNCSLQNDQRRTGENGAATTIFTASDTEGSSIITVRWDEDEDVEGSTYIDIEQGGE